MMPLMRGETAVDLAQLAEMYDGNDLRAERLFYSTKAVSGSVKVTLDKLLQTISETREDPVWNKPIFAH